MKPLHLLSLVVSFTVSFAGIAFAEDAANNSDDEAAEEQTWQTESDVRVYIELLSGDIEIEGWDRNEVRVRVDGGAASDLDVRASRKRIRIRGPKFGRGRRFWDAGDLDVDVHVSVPIHSRIEAKTTNGTIKAQDVAGTLEFNTANGDIDIRGEPSEVRIETINASIDFEGTVSEVDARTVNGDINLKGVAGELFASAISGSIRVEGDALERVELKTLSGSIELAGSLVEDARVHLKSISGAIEIELPSDTSARFDVQSFSGGIRNDLPTTRTNTSGRHGRHLKFTAGEGDGRVTIESFSGGVEIRGGD